MNELNLGSDWLVIKYSTYCIPLSGPNAIYNWDQINRAGKYLYFAEMSSLSYRRTRLLTKLCYALDKDIWIDDAIFQADGVNTIANWDGRFMGLHGQLSRMFPKIKEGTFADAISFIIAMSNKKWQDVRSVEVPASSWRAEDLKLNSLPSVKFQSPSVIIQEGTVVLDILYILSGIQGSSLNYDDILPNAVIRVDPRLDNSLTILLEGSMNELRVFLEVRTR